MEFSIEQNLISYIKFKTYSLCNPLLYKTCVIFFLLGINFIIADKLKPGCRVSGLSKKSRKSKSGSIDTKTQPKLRDMFAKFAHSKQ